VIDELLADPRFAAHLADIWDDYLMPAGDNSRSGKPRLAEWLELAFRTQSWDGIADELLTASGRQDDNAAVTYLLKGRQTLSPGELTDLVSQYFLGLRLNCCQCHDHPFAAWTQNDYWGLAAFFTQIQYTDRRQLKSASIRDDLAVDLSKLEDAAKLRKPRFLGGAAPLSSHEISHRRPRSAATSRKARSWASPTAPPVKSWSVRCRSSTSWPPFANCWASITRKRTGRPASIGPSESWTRTKNRLRN
jgi:hypothetical protein